VEIAIASFPIGKAISADRHHLHIVGQEVITGMSSIFMHTFKKYFCFEPLADEPAAVVRESDDHSADLITLNQVSELFDTQHPWQSGSGFARLIVRHNRNMRSLHRFSPQQLKPLFKMVQFSGEPLAPT
jgi:hypothetical protein